MIFALIAFLKTPSNVLCSNPTQGRISPQKGIRKPVDPPSSQTEFILVMMDLLLKQAAINCPSRFIYTGLEFTLFQKFRPYLGAKLERCSSTLRLKGGGTIKAGLFSF